MPETVPVTLVYSFYALVAWGLSALFVAFRILADESIKAGLWMRLGVLAWMGVPAVLALRGVLLDVSETPPNLMRVVIPMMLLIIGFSFSSLGRKAAERLPMSFLVGVNGFRLPLEILLYALAGHALLPKEMTFAGYNYDILSGIAALFLWLMLHKQKAPAWMLWAFNIGGLVLLLTIVTVAILAFPAPFGLFQPPNFLVAFYPWMWLPTFLVPIALLSHLLIFRKLMLPPPPPSANI